MTYLVVVPVRGIRISNAPPTLDIFNRRWSLIDAGDFERLGELHTRNHSLRGNIRQLVERLAPHSLLLVRYGDGQRESPWDERYADDKLAAISLACLLRRSSIEGVGVVPHAVYRPRYRELCDLPLAFDEVRVRGTGHTGRLGLLSAGEHHAPLTLDDLDAQIDSCPAVVRKMLGGEALDRREIRLRAAARGILSCFDATSVGGLVSAAISSAEILVDAQVEAEIGRDRSWRRKEARLRLAVGSDFEARVTGVLRARHRYVHATLQPEFSWAGEAALAIAVQTWVVMHDLYARYGSTGDTEAFLDCVDAASRTTSDALQELRSQASTIPRGPADELHWVRKYLLDIHPNEYTCRYVRHGKINCIACGHLNGTEQVVRSEGNRHEYRCHTCGEMWWGTMLDLR